MIVTPHKGLVGHTLQRGAQMESPGLSAGAHGENTEVWSHPDAVPTEAMMEAWSDNKRTLTSYSFLSLEVLAVDQAPTSYIKPFPLLLDHFTELTPLSLLIIIAAL